MRYLWTLTKVLLPLVAKTNIFLLTDGATAIDEAHEFYPDTNWIYFNRTRFRGSAGGWENQIPSNSPKAEVVTLLATLQLVCLCDTIVHGISFFPICLLTPCVPWNMIVPEVRSSVIVWMMGLRMSTAPTTLIRTRSWNRRCLLEKRQSL